MLRRHWLTLVKVGAAFAIIGFLVWRAVAEAGEQGLDIAGHPKNWPLLIGAWALFLIALVITIVRWYMLVRALEIPFKLRDAFRLGFLCYMLTFFSLGSVGGDVFKAIFIAREQKKARAEAVATVLVDRIIGLYGLFIVTSICVLAGGLWSSPVEEIRVIAKFTLISTCVGAIFILMLIVPGFTTGAVSEFLSELPRIGPLFRKLIGAVRMYRRKPLVLIVATVMSLGVHTCATLGIYLLGRGMLKEVPTLAEHFVIVPPAMLAGAIPLLPMGLGAFEGALAFLFARVPANVPLSNLAVLLVAFGYRAITIINAAIGAVIWITSRREVAELMHEAEQQEEPAADAPGPSGETSQPSGETSAGSS